MLTLTRMTSPHSPDHSPKKRRLTDAELEALKALHQAVHAHLREAHALQSLHGGHPRADIVAGQHHRLALLAWAFVRGLPYRRVEPFRHLQVRSVSDGAIVSVRHGELAMHGVDLYEHHRPDGLALHALLSRYIPDLSLERVDAWLDEPHQAPDEYVVALVQRFQDRVEAEREAARAAHEEAVAATQPSLFPAYIDLIDRSKTLQVNLD